MPANGTPDGETADERSNATEWDGTERRIAPRRGSDRPWAQSTIRVGSDMVTVDEVAASIDRFGERYLRRVFTEQERTTCTGEYGPSADRLAARFAAKESVIKALRPEDGIALHDIEVQLDADGGPEIQLRGCVADCAEALGVVDTSLSLTHDDGRASAVFVAVLSTPLPSIALPPPTLDPLARLSDLFPAGVPFDSRYDSIDHTQEAV